jgi:hypothetical protein
MAPDATSGRASQAAATSCRERGAAEHDGRAAGERAAAREEEGGGGQAAERD